ncbi:MAG: YegP family protein [Halobacteriaceae archaeon]
MEGLVGTVLCLSRGRTGITLSPPASPATEALDDDFAADAPDVPRSSLGRFEVYQDTADEWRWRLVHRNGDVVATGGEGDALRQNAEKGLRSVMQNALDAVVSRAE